MKKCLRCSSQYIGASIFCDNCQSSLLGNTLRQEERLPNHFLLPVDAPNQEITRASAGTSSPSMAQASFSPIKQQPMEQVISIPNAVNFTTVRHRHRLRVARTKKVFLWLAVLAVVALAIDSLLIVFVAKINLDHQDQLASVPPILTLSQTVANRGEIVTLYVAHCQPFAHIFLSHD